MTLSGAGQRRILYMNTCDPAQIWTTSHCQNQDSPQLTIQGLHFTQGNSTGDLREGGGGGAVFVRGGRVKVIESSFTANRCDPTGPDLGGASLRVLSQYQGLPVIVATSTFGGSPGEENICSNGAAISSIGVSWQIFNSVFTYNNAIGTGANPARPGTPGGGSGGAIYLDGNLFTLDLAGSIMRDNARQRRWWRDLLRLQRPHGRAPHHEVGARTQPESRLRDRRLPGDLLPRPRSTAGDRHRDQLT